MPEGCSRSRLWLHFTDGNKHDLNLFDNVRLHVENFKIN